MWNYARSLDEIRHDMFVSLRSNATALSNMVFYYSMDTPSATKVADDSGHGFDATIGTAQDGTFTNQDRRKPLFRVSTAPIAGAPIVKRLVALNQNEPVSVVFDMTEGASDPVPQTDTLYMSFTTLSGSVYVQKRAVDGAGVVSLSDVEVSVLRLIACVSVLFLRVC